MPRLEYGLKTGDLTEEAMVKGLEKALTRAAKATSDLHVAKNRKKLKKYTGPFGRSTPDAEPPDYDHIYNFSCGRHGGCDLFLQLYPNMERNGRVKFPQEGITWGMYIDFSYGRELTPGILEDMGVQRPEEYALHFLREFTRLFPGQLVLLHRYTRGENRL